MKLSLKRMTVAASAVALIGGGGAIVNAAPAEAATPGNLQLYGWVNCYWKGWGPTWDNLPGWRMHRVLGVRNTGDGTMNGVTISEFGGATKSVKVGNQPAGQLKKGQFYRLVNTTWKACFPSSVSGYTIGREVENPVDNVGFWMNFQQQEGDPGTVTPPSGGGTGGGTSGG